MSTYRLRRPTTSEAERLYAIHRLAMRALVEQVYGPWDDDVQRPRHEAWLALPTVRVIERDGNVAGAIDVQWESDHAFLSRIELGPTCQGQGLGTEVITDLLAEAAARNLEVRLEVWDVNPAVRLYERLGFTRVAEVGHKIHMTCASTTAP